MSIAQTIRASGDTLSASLDTDKFTGTSIRQTRILLEEESRADVLSEEEEQEQQTQDDEDEDEPKRFWVPQEETAL